MLSALMILEPMCEPSQCIMTLNDFFQAMRCLWMLNVLPNRFWRGYFNSVRGQNGPIHTRLQESTAANASDTCQYPPRELHLASHWSGTVPRLCSSSATILTRDTLHILFSWCSPIQIKHLNIFKTSLFYTW